MALYTLDTDTLTLLAAGHPRVSARYTAEPATDVAVAVISVEEQLNGWYNYVRRATRPDQVVYGHARYADAARFLLPLPILNFTVPALARYESLRRLKLNAGANDLRIAAIALEYGAVVVTGNRRDFGRVPGLVIEDWSVP